jgi:hypothetical protein
MAFGRVLVDWNVLCHHQLRPLIVALGSEDRGLFEVRWTAGILEGTVRCLHRRRRGRLTEPQSQAIVTGLTTRWPDALILPADITAARAHLSSASSPFAPDPHYDYFRAVAAAGDTWDVVSFDAGSYVRFNDDSDFGATSPEFFSPDEFFLLLYKPYYDARVTGRPVPDNPVDAAIRDLAAGSSVSDLLRRLKRSGLPKFREALKHLDDEAWS